MRLMHSSLAILLIAPLHLPAATYAQAPAPAPAGTDIYLVSLFREGGRLAFGTPINVTDRDGYDNQPSFLPDGQGLLYTSNLGDQTDIYRYFIETRNTERVTHTSPESEYSPTVTPAGDAFSVIRVEADSTQRLWQFTMDGENPTLVLTEVKPVGYHAWGDDHTLGLFVLGDSTTPATFRLADTHSGRAQIIAYNVGRSIKKIPGRDAISFTHRVPQHWMKEIDLHTHAVRPLIQLLSGGQDYAWMPDGTALMGQGSKLFRWAPKSGATWEQVADFADAGIQGITRLAVSPQGDWLAIVGARETHR